MLTQINTPFKLISCYLGVPLPFSSTRQIFALQMLQNIGNIVNKCAKYKVSTKNNTDFFIKINKYVSFTKNL
jgi:hypothetical protein